MMEVIATERIDRETIQIYKRLLNQSEQRADRFLVRVEESIENLKSFPEFGKRVPMSELRRVLIRSFREYVLYYLTVSQIVLETE